MRRQHRRLALRQVGEAMTVGLAIGSLAASVGVVAFWAFSGRAFSWLIPAGIAVGGALLAGLCRLVRGVTLDQTARFLDARLRTGELLASAWSVMDRQDAWAQRLQAQAAALLSEPAVANAPLWTRTRRTPAAAALSVALCLTLTLSAGGGNAKVSYADPASIAGQEDSAQAAAGALARRLETLRRDDPQAYLRLVESLRRAETAPADAAIASIAGTHDDGKGSSSGAGLSDARKAKPMESGTALPAGGVYVQRTSSVDAAQGQAGTGVATGESKPGDAAWEAAQREASLRLGRGDVPIEYRRLVRRFFDDSRQ